MDNKKPWEKEIIPMEVLFYQFIRDEGHLPGFPDVKVSKEEIEKYRIKLYGEEVNYYTCGPHEWTGTVSCPQCEEEKSVRYFNIDPKIVEQLQRIEDKLDQLLSKGE